MQPPSRKAHTVRHRRALSQTASPAALVEPASPAAAWLDTKRAARHCSLSESFLEKARCAGSGPVYSKIGSRIVYSRAALDSWLLATQRRSTADPGAGRGHPEAAP